MNKTTVVLEEVIRAVAAGRPGACETLVATVRRPLFAYLFRLGRQSETAEDLLQDVLFILCTKADTFTAGRKFWPWAYAIARNRFLEWKRQESRIVRLHRAVQAAVPPAALHPQAEADRRLDIARALEKLSLEVRETFVLKHFQGLTFNEVAEVQGIPVPTAKSRVLFALRKLQDALGANA
jgi:RNA polymerase sigma-70 factor, ECF subfamily